MRVLCAVSLAASVGGPPSVEPISAHELPGGPLAVDLQARDTVLRAVHAVMRCHGAVQMTSSLVGFAGAPAGVGRDAVRLLTSSGTQLVLRHDMRHGFATWLSQQAAAAALAGAAGEDAATQG